MDILKSSDIKSASRVLRRGDILVVPTQRWYMLCCMADNTEACSNIFAAKRRPSDRQLLFILPSKGDIDRYVRLTPEAQKLSDRLWPGELAILLNWISEAVAKKYKSFSRLSALVHIAPGCLGAIAAMVGAPIASTSANISGSANSNGFGPAVTLAEALSFLRASGLDAAATIDGGLCPLFTPTTIIECTVARAMKITRLGAIPERVIAAALL